MKAPDDHRHLTRRRRALGDRGSVAVEVAVIAPALVMLMLLVVFAGHVAQADGDVQRAASQAARAASLRQHPDTAIADATATATANLADAGIACDPLTVDVDTSQFVAGGIVTVDVTCVASLSSITLLGVPGQRSFHARSVEIIDAHRSN